MILKFVCRIVVLQESSNLSGLVSVMNVQPETIEGFIISGATLDCEIMVWNVERRNSGSMTTVLNRIDADADHM